MNKAWIFKHKKSVLGILIGAMVGYLYYSFVGCSSGSCLIASNPFIMVPYTAILGYLFVGMFTKKEAESKKT